MSEKSYRENLQKGIAEQMRQTQVRVDFYTLETHTLNINETHFQGFLCTSMLGIRKICRFKSWTSTLYYKQKPYSSEL